MILRIAPACLTCCGCDTSMLHPSADSVNRLMPTCHTLAGYYACVALLPQLDRCPTTRARTGARTCTHTCHAWPHATPTALPCTHMHTCPHTQPHSHAPMHAPMSHTLHA